MSPCGVRHRRWIHHTPSVIRSSSAQAPQAQSVTIAGKASSRFHVCVSACVAPTSASFANATGTFAVVATATGASASCHAMVSIGAKAQASSAPQATA